MQLVVAASRTEEVLLFGFQNWFFVQASSHQRKVFSLWGDLLSRVRLVVPCVVTKNLNCYVFSHPISCNLIEFNQIKFYDFSFIKRKFNRVLQKGSIKGISTGFFICKVYYFYFAIVTVY